MSGWHKASAMLLLKDMLPEVGDLQRSSDVAEPSLMSHRPAGKKTCEKRDEHRNFLRYFLAQNTKNKNANNQFLFISFFKKLSRP